MLLQFILDEYASKHPGTIKPETENLAQDPSDAAVAGPHGTSSAPQSDFGKLIIRGTGGENTANTSTDSALLVYTGNSCFSLFCLYRE